MADNYGTLAQGTISNVAGVLYTVPGGAQVIVREFTVTNTDSVTRTITVYKNGTGVSNIIKKSLSLNAGETVELVGIRSMAAGETLQAVADAASVVAFTLGGLKIT